MTLEPFQNNPNVGLHKEHRPQNKILSGARKVGGGALILLGAYGIGQGLKAINIESLFPYGKYANSIDNADWYLVKRRNIWNEAYGSESTLHDYKTRKIYAGKVAEANGLINDQNRNSDPVGILDNFTGESIGLPEVDGDNRIAGIEVRLLESFEPIVFEARKQ